MPGKNQDVSNRPTRVIRRVVANPNRSKNYSTLAEGLQGATQPQLGPRVSNTEVLHDLVDPSLTLLLNAHPDQVDQAEDLIQVHLDQAVQELAQVVVEDHQVEVDHRVEAEEKDNLNFKKLTKK